ncbi:MAG TPA: PaaI family thioesterase [Macromonas sp.]|nr:PaaI family thioesterase [Macromonas sp.]
MEFDQSMTFVRLLGFELASRDAGQCAVRYAPTADHCNSFHVTHGGILMTLLDVCMSQAARSVQTDMGAITIEMKTTFMRAAKGPLAGHGRLVQRTATLAFCEAQVHDAQGQLCATASGTFKYVRKLATGAKQVANDAALGDASD